MSQAIDKLVEIMKRLRAPNGCPWDREQTFESIGPYTLEETYEVLEAIEVNDPKALRGELGDLLFQIVFHAQIGAEQGLFDFDAIATQVTDKMIERHPHVFGDRNAATSNDVLVNWEADKAARREAVAKAANRPISALDDVSTALPAATRAVKLQKRAARVGFDWNDVTDIVAKIREEIDELEQEIKNVESRDQIEDELGDVFFAIVNLARHLEIDPETALRRTNRKFETRFRFMEKALTDQGKQLRETSLDEMEKYWVEAKLEERKTVKG